MSNLDYRSKAIATKRLIFIVIETIVVTTTLVMYRLPQYRYEETLPIGWYVSFGLPFAPFLLLISSVVLYRDQRHLFWIGIVTFLCILIFLLLPGVTDMR